MNPFLCLRFVNVNRTSSGGSSLAVSSRIFSAPLLEQVIRVYLIQRLGPTSYEIRTHSETLFPFIIDVTGWDVYYPDQQMHNIYTGCPRGNVQNFGRVFLMLNYTDITQNTYIQS
jgi:hypothetical protein